MKLWALLAGLVFFIAGLFTLSHYGIMWDGRGHFVKGQAYINFLLRGWRTYDELPVTSSQVRYHRDYLSRRGGFVPEIVDRLSSDSSFRRSVYQDDTHTYDFYIKKDSGHPPLSDIGAAFFNILFYEKLGILRDDHAYHLFSLVLASILVGVTFHWISTSYGYFAGGISALTLITYPLFWAESHYNIKDIPQAVFFSLAIWAFWRSLSSRSVLWFIGSAVFAGCALGTKFNIVFLPLILLPWLFIFYRQQTKEERRACLRWWWLLFVYPAVMLAVLFVSYPYLWQNPLPNFFNIIGYYRNIGTNIDYTPAFRFFWGFNSYALIWIFFTTYPWVIFFAFIGGAGAVISAFKSKNVLPLLFLLWFLTPILRVSLPKTAIYGGSRQIMEYIPALSLLAGYGSYLLIEKFSHRWKSIGRVIIFVGFIPLFITLVHYHPLENVYFNSLIGGLAGAKKAKINQWGNTYGSIYHQGVIWLNAHAEPDSHVATAFGDTADFYIPELREDLLADQQFSGYLQKGEYVIGLTNDTELEHTYRLRYLNQYLEPVYIYEVDNVALLKIWKNDRQHLRKEIQSLQEKTIVLKPRKKEGELRWDLGKRERITRVEIEFESAPSCQSIELAYFQISQDDEQWEILPETYPGGPIDVLPHQPQSEKLIAPIAALAARYISLVVEPKDACLLKPTISKIFILGE